MARVKKDQKVVITGLSVQVDGKEFITGTTISMTTEVDIQGHKNVMVQKSSSLIKDLIDMLSWNPLEVNIIEKSRSGIRNVSVDELLKEDPDPK